MPKSPKSWSRSRLVAVLFATVLILGTLSPLKASLRSIVLTLGKPLHFAGQRVPRLFSNDRSDKEVLEQELVRLRSGKSAEQLERENERLRELLRFTQKTPMTFVGAEVIGFDPASVRSAITINRGSRDGLTEGMAVVGNGFLVGKVEKVSERRADIILITDPAFRVQAMDRASEARGIVRGEIGASVRLTNVVEGEKLAIGDHVVTTGSQGTFPKGLVIGEILSTEQTAGTVFQSAVIKPGTDLDRLQFVLVVTSYE